MRKIILGLTTMALLTQPVLAQQASIEDRVSELEAQNSLNIFSFSGTFNTRYDSIKYDPLITTANSTNTDLGEATHDVMRMKLGLNINADVSPKIKFYTTLSASKMFNLFATQGSSATTLETPLTGDLGDANTYESSSIFLEKAYMDYFFAENWAFSIGRLPSVNGPPSHFWDGVARQGTYPLHLYNSNLDGIALSHNMNRWMPEGYTLDARVIYTPLQYKNLKNPPAGLTDKNGNKMNSKSDLVAYQFEVGSPSSTWTDSWSFIYSHLKINPINLNFEISSSAPFTSTPDLTAVINYDFDVINFEAQGIAGTGFDLHLLHVSTKIQQENYGSVVSSLNFEKDYAGNGSLVGLRYRFNSSNLLGAEVISNSKYFFIGDSSSGSLSNLYGTNGKANHVYYTHKLESNLGLRIGMTQQDPEYNSFDGGTEPTEREQKITGYYANLRLDF